MFEQLRPELVSYADEAGRQPFDLPDAPRPDPDVPAPVRFLPEFDAPLLAYADRTRIITDEVRRVVCRSDAVAATVLVDGDRDRDLDTRSHVDGAAVLTVRPLRPLTRAERATVEAEGTALLAFTDPDTTRHEVRLLG